MSYSEIFTIPASAAYMRAWDRFTQTPEYQQTVKMLAKELPNETRDRVETGLMYMFVAGWNSKTVSEAILTVTHKLARQEAKDGD